MSIPLRPYSVGMASRAAQRKQRLLEIENEQRREEAEALRMTEEQRQTLVRSFSSVKVEFSDLDGLSWKESARYPAFHLPPPKNESHRRPPPPMMPQCLTSPRKGVQPAAENTIVMILPSLDPEETIRPSALSPLYNNSLHRYYHSPAQESYPPSRSHSPSSSLRRALSLKNIKAFTFKSKSKRRRLPLQGVFPSVHPRSSQEDSGQDSDSDSDNTVLGGEPTRKARGAASWRGHGKAHQDPWGLHASSCPPT